MTETTTFTVDGMTCAACAGRVERVVRTMPGIEGVSVNLLSAKVQLQSSGAPDMTAISAALAKAGYPISTAETDLLVDGMTCASCVGRVERALRSAPGVLDASVNLAIGQAHVRYTGGATSPTELAQIISRAGYSAHTKSADATQTVTDRQAGEAAALQQRLIWAAALTLPVVLLSMGAHAVPAFHHWLMANVGEKALGVVQFALTLAVLVGPGRQFILHGFPALFRGAPEMNSLVAIGSMAAFLYSAVATFAPQLLPVGANQVYYEAAASIVTLILLGRFLEARAKGRAGAAIARLAGLAPKVATVLRQGVPVEIPVEELLRSDLVQLRPGERVAVDGIISEGHGFIDESMLTGEPVPVEKRPGDRLTGGTLNGTSGLTYQVTAVGQNTVLSQIIRLVEDAQGAKLPVQALVDKITLWFVPTVMVLAVVTAVLWFWLGPDPALSHALVAGISVLIIACPCAMGLATPVSVLVGSGRGAELGILFRKGDALQNLASTTLVAFDKTGTLTEGHPSLSDIWISGATTEDQALAMAAAAEAGSEHPLARALIDASTARGLTLPQASSGQALPGRGYQATVGTAKVLIGNLAAIEASGVDASALRPQAEAAADAGKTPVFMAVDGTCVALFAVSDKMRPTALAAIQRLNKAGIDTAMISGDTQRTADAVARQLGIDTVIAGVLPDGKVAALKGMAKGGHVAFVGDGLNDAPALAAADVGIAMGGGTDLAREAAEVVIVRSDPALVADAILLSKATLRNIRQNLFWAFGYNAVLIPVAAGALYPVNGMLLSPVLASAAMALSSVFVVSNALRLRRFSA